MATLSTQPECIIIIRAVHCLVAQNYPVGLGERQPLDRQGHTHALNTPPRSFPVCQFCWTSVSIDFGKAPGLNVLSDFQIETLYDRSPMDLSP